MGGHVGFLTWSKWR